MEDTEETLRRRLKKALGTRGLARLKRIERDALVARTLRNDETIKPKACTVCEAPMNPYEGRGRPKKTCSLACAKKRQRILINAARDSKAP